MEKKPPTNTAPSTPLTKPNWQVRVVSNSDKENIVPDIFLSPSENSAFARSDSRDNSFFVQVDPIPQEILNPFLSEFKRVSLTRDNSSFGGQNLQLNESANLKKTDSIMTADSVSSELSLISLQNRAKGFKIPQSQEHRVLSDITSEHVPSRTMSDFGPTRIEAAETENSNLLPEVDFDSPARETLPAVKKRPRPNKENWSKNLVQPLLKYKRAKRPKKFGLQSRVNRRSMRI